MSRAKQHARKFEKGSIARAGRQENTNIHYVVTMLRRAPTAGF